MAIMVPHQVDTGFIIKPLILGTLGVGTYQKQKQNDQSKNKNTKNIKKLPYVSILGTKLRKE